MREAFVLDVLTEMAEHDTELYAGSDRTDCMAGNK